MSIKIVLDNNLYCPKIFCDYCGNEIEDAKQGNYEWKSGFNAGFTSEIFFTHKQCCFPFEEQHGGRSTWMTGELQVFPLFLKRNLNIDSKREKELAELSFRP